MRSLVLLALVGCAAATNDLPLEHAPTPVGDLAVEAAGGGFGAVVAGAEVTLVATNATPGDLVRFGVSNQVGSGPCPSVLAGYCLDLLQPTLLGQATADATGRAELTRTLPDTVPASTVWLQAVSTGTALEISAPTEILVQPASWRGNLDCVHACEARPADGGFCWSNDTTGFVCADPDGCVDACIADCQALVPTLDDTERDALGVCAASDPVCYQTIEQCIEGEASSGVWLNPTYDGRTDANGDGRWSPGELLAIDGAMHSRGIDFYGYPSIVLEADHPGVSIAGSEQIFYGIAAGDAYPVQWDVVAMGVPPGTDVTFTMSISGLGCLQGRWPDCPLPNAVEFVVPVQ